MSPRLLMASCVLVAAGPGAAQTPSFSSGVDAVRVDVLVTDNGRLVPNLRPEDFEVLDNGVVQHVDLASYEEMPLNVILALDLSASLDARQLDDLREAGRALLDGLKPDDQVALVTFSHVVSQAAPLTSEHRRVEAALEAASASGETSLVDASFVGMTIGEADIGRSLLLVFSDGVDTRSWLSTQAVLEMAKRGEIVVYGVEVGSRDVSFPRELSAATGGRTLAIESTGDLHATFRGILSEFRQRYLISYSPRGVTTGGWHRLDVRVKGRNVAVRARPGYQAVH
jgi:VWFA-related protein